MVFHVIKLHLKACDYTNFNVTFAWFPKPNSIVTGAQNRWKLCELISIITGLPQISWTHKGGHSTISSLPNNAILMGHTQRWMPLVMRGSMKRASLRFHKTQIKSIELVACSNVHILMTLYCHQLCGCRGGYINMWTESLDSTKWYDDKVYIYLYTYLNNISSIKSCPLLRIWRMYDRSDSTSFVKLGQRHIAWNYPFLFHPDLFIKFASRIPLLHLHFSPDWWPNIHLI